MVLRPGDRVAVVAPSGPFDRPTFEKGLALLAARYQPVFTERLFARHRYLAGPAEARRAELQAALDDASLRAVFAARGGYGAMHLLPALRFSAPKPLVGFSDLTALHAAALHHGYRPLHGPVLTQLGTQPPEVVERLWSLLEGRPVPPLTATRTVVPGVTEGPLVGGNLAVLAALAGTPFLPPLEGAVLLLEDIGERPYRLDRLWTQLALSGALAGVQGVVLGDFTGCEEPGAAFTSAEVLDELAATLGRPCAAGFPIGHGAVNVPVQLGARVRLDAAAKTLTALE